MNIVLTEWVASLIAAAGSVWFTYDVTASFHRVYLILPPTQGPTEVIGLGILIWLYAKHQRFLKSQMVHARVEIQNENS